MRTYKYRDGRNIGLGAVFLFALGISAWNYSHAAQQGADLIRLGMGSIIVVEGDSLTYGYDASLSGITNSINGSTQPRSRSPYPETLGSLVSACASVVNHGFPGDRSVDGLVRWQDSTPSDVAILMYGTNDALNFGQSPTGRVNLETFRAVLSLLVTRRRNQGAKSIIMAPPPIKNSVSDKLLAPFRASAQQVAVREGVKFIDTTALLTGVVEPWTDGVHLSALANLRIAESLAAIVSCR